MNEFRKKIIENFRERMQLRRSLIELEDQNNKNSIEVGRRQILVMEWVEKHGETKYSDGEKLDIESLLKDEEYILKLSEKCPDDIKKSWSECEQLQKTIDKNSAMKKSIAKRLRSNEKVAE